MKRRPRTGQRRRRTLASVLVGALLVMSLGGVAYAWVTTTNNPGNSITGATLGATTGLAATPTVAGNSCTSVALAWTAAPSANRYRIEVAIGAGAYSTLVASHTTTSYTDTVVYTNSTVTWRVTPTSLNSSWTGTPQTVSTTCGIGDITDLAATSSCGTTVLTWTAPPNATRYDVQVRVNGGAWTTISADQSAVTYTDIAAYADGDDLDYRVLPKTNAGGGASGNWTPPVSIVDWAAFRIVSIAFGNSGAGGVLNAGDTITVTYSQAVDVTSLTLTNLQTKTNGQAATHGIFIAASGTQASKSQVGGITGYSGFSAGATLAGTAAWSAGNTVWTWTSSGGGTNMASPISGTWEPGTDGGAAKCAGNGTTTAIGTPTRTGQW